jgi:hypothetical protein
MFSNAANNSVSESDLRRVLASPEGQKLLALLRTDGGGALKQAMQAVKDGDYEGAKTALDPMLQSPEAKKLLEQLKTE